jgi:hypothetical protein
MSYPEININTIDLDIAAKDIIATIALEEAGLAHILNAEGEKLQALISDPNIVMADLVSVNETVTKTVSGIAKMEGALRRKFNDLYGITIDKPFEFLQTDQLDYPIQGGTYTLTNGIATYEVMGGPDGIIRFNVIPEGDYILHVLISPHSFADDNHDYYVHINEYGNATIDGVNADDFVLVHQPAKGLRFLKLNENGKRLDGGWFKMTENGGSTVVNTFSDHGIVWLDYPWPGSWILTEEYPPFGYKPSSQQYTVDVAADGSITVDGIDMEDFSWVNEKEEVFYFYKVNQNGDFLDGGLWDLYDVSTGKNHYQATAVNGRVSVSVDDASWYIMEELSPPRGYKPSTQKYDVVVNGSGTTTINGIDSKSFKMVNEPL